MFCLIRNLLNLCPASIHGDIKENSGTPIDIMLCSSCFLVVFLIAKHFTKPKVTHNFPRKNPSECRDDKRFLYQFKRGMFPFVRAACDQQKHQIHAHNRTHNRDSAEPTLMGKNATGIRIQIHSWSRRSKSATNQSAGEDNLAWHADGSSGSTARRLPLSKTSGRNSFASSTRKRTSGTA